MSSSVSNRRAAIEQSYQSLRPMVQYLGRKIGSGSTFLDVGSGEGIISLKMADDLQAHRVILVDNAYKPIVDLPPQAEFHLCDVHSDEFVRRFQNKANVVICLNAFHEFDNPAVASMNLIRIMPMGGVALILDYTEEGWERQRAIAAISDSICKLHFQEDMARVARYGFQTDSGIREFWEEGVFPRVPGECVLAFSGDLYNVLYIPRQWGEVKQPPPEVKRLLESLR